MAATEPPAPPPAILYVDTSALLKLLVREAESAAIERELLTWEELATSVIAEVELPRAVARAREERADAVIDGSVVLQGVLSSAASARLMPSTSPVRSASPSSLQASLPTTSVCRMPLSPSESA
jgi:predicted nucleic acid-binding protein